MSRYYQNLDAPHFDYGLIELPGLQRPIRGPAVDLDAPFVACIGAAQTFGRFCEQPFPAQLKQRLGIPVLNLAIGGSGPALYRQPALLSVLQRARLVVAQVLSGRSASNSEFHTDGEIQGILTATGERGRFEPLLPGILASRPREFVARLLAETRADFSAQFRALIAEVGCPTVLFWFAARKPDYEAGFGSVAELLGGFPHFIDRTTVDAIAATAAGYVECVGNRGFPQRLWRADAAIEGTRRHEDGWLYNHYYPTQAMHDDATAALEATCRSLLAAD
ncbi:MAG: hypothetical protein KDE27_09435 [Planctomycetes bacterium]|nr:hypothetical protein [Planctomycetota bacterium]